MTQLRDSTADQFNRLYAQPVLGIDANSNLAAGVPGRVDIEGQSSDVNVLSCEVCGQSAVQVIFSLPGTRFVTIRCRSCGLGSLWPRPSPAEIASFYPQHYYGNEGNKFTGIVEALVRIVGARRSRFFANLCPAGGRILDVGCGRGVTLQSLAGDGFETHGFEVSDDAIEGLDNRIQTRVGASLSDVRYSANFFDEVIVWHVLEHVPEPAATLREIHRILKPGGIVVVAVPNFSSLQARFFGPAWFHLDPPRHLFHFPLVGLKQMLESCGFDYRSEHHFSLRQNPFGWIQSFQNLLPWLPRNSLYAVLQRTHGSSRPFSRALRLQLWMLCVLMSPLALVLSIVAALFRRGATVHVVAVRRDSAK